MPLLSRDQERFLEALACVRKFVPKFRVRDKADSFLQRAIGWLLKYVGNPDYMRNYWTTIGYTTYRSTVVYPDEWLTVLHEGCHAVQRKRWRFLFYIGYLFPQILAIPFVALAVSCGWWWLLGLVCLAPLPAPFRWLAERQAYRVSIVCGSTYYGDNYDLGGMIESVESNLSTGAYYWTWPFKASYKYFKRPISESASRYEEECRWLVERLKAEDATS